MKNTLFISAMLLSGFAMASPQFSTTTVSELTFVQNEEKVKIDPNDLPEPIKTTIMSDESINKYQIAEAWKVALSEGVFHYIVTFENGTEEKISKKYDEEGIEIKD